MTIRQLFREVFRETLAEHGFGYKYNYFYRLNGEMLQGVTVVPSYGGGYFLRVACYPYWMHDFINDANIRNTFKKPYWVEQFDVKSGEMTFFLQDSPDNCPMMERLLQNFLKNVLPAMDAICDVQSMGEAIIDGGVVERVDSKLLLYVCNGKGSFDFAKEYFTIREREFFSPEHIRLLSSLQQKELTAEEMQVKWRGQLKFFTPLIECIEKNDLDSVLAPYKDNREAMKERLRKELKIDFSHLE